MKLMPGILMFLLLATGSAIGKPVDFGDHSSNTLIERAAEAMEQGDLKAVDAYTKRCITLYSAEARRMQKKLKGYPSEDTAFDYWALNHVAYAHVLRAQMLEKRNRRRAAFNEYDIPLRKYEYALCYDPSTNRFWKIGDLCVERRAILESQGLDK